MVDRCRLARGPVAVNSDDDFVCVQLTLETNFSEPTVTRETYFLQKDQPSSMNDLSLPIQSDLE